VISLRPVRRFRRLRCDRATVLSKFRPPGKNLAQERARAEALDRDLAAARQDQEGRRRAFLRVPTKPAMHSNLKPAGYSDRKPAGIMESAEHQTDAIEPIAEVVGFKGERHKPSYRSVRCPMFTYVQLSR
jgi:hypothetical protein